ncbi:MAG: methylamine dehydrogenase accessory protein MauD [Parvicella sp.]|jgi:methylamine dehydrogenase accessory protein MauD
MTDPLVVSNIILWLAVILLSVVVLALVRQVGVLYERIAPAGALMAQQSISVGDAAPTLSLQEFNTQQTVDIGKASSDGKSQLLFFVAPDCPICKTLLPAFKSASFAETKWLNFALASDGDSDEMKRFITDQRLKSFPFFNSRELGLALGVAKLPFAVLIDEAGKIASMGLVNSREHFDSLFNAKEAKVASIQEYLETKTSRQS